MVFSLCVINVLLNILTTDFYKNKKKQNNPSNRVPMFVTLQNFCTEILYIHIHIYIHIH